MKSSPLSPQEAEAMAQVVSAAQRMQEDPLLRNLRDGYLVGQIEALEAEAMQKLIKANSLESFFDAKATLLASVKMADFHSRLVQFGKPSPEPKPAK
jgi:hypothetical protein